jgi:hypothetical protein
MFLEERITVLEQRVALLVDEIRKLREDLVHPSTTTPDVPRLEIPGKLTLTTKEAAYLLNRAPQTLRVWATYDNGPIRPQRVNGRLMWITKDIAALIKHGNQ